MTELTCDLVVAQAIALIKSYSFDTNGNSAEKLVQKWLNNYQETWVRLAVIEALYLGRYKTVSIEQIMAVWFRIGMPNIHFKAEFERLICRKLPKHLVITDSFWFEAEESPVFNKNSDANLALSHQSSSLLTSESSSQIESVTAESNFPKTLSEVKNILTKSEEAEVLIPSLHLSLTQQTRKDLWSDSSLDEEPSLLKPIDQQHQLETESLESYYLSHNSPIITNFHPIPDNSAFFQKLKSFALNLD